MARYRKVDPRIWNDAKFMKLGHLGQMMFLYILTHPNMTMIGMLRSKKEALAFERGWDLEALNEAFDLALRLGLLEYHDVGLICLPNFIRYNEPESVTVVKSWHKCLDFLPECELRAKYLDKAYQYCKNRGEAFEKGFVETIGKPNFEPSGEANNEPSCEVVPYQITESRKQKNTNKHLSMNMVEDEAPAPVDVCDEFENPFFDEPPFEFNPEPVPDPVTNGKPVDVSSVFQMFGQKPVVNHDDQCFDAPIGQLIDDSNLRNNEKVLQNDNHVLTASQIIVLAKTLGTSLGHSARLDEIANRKTLTVGMVKKVIEDWKATRTSTGYLIGYLDNVSANPSQLNGKRKDREINAETISNGQCFAFANKLGHYHPFASVNAHSNEQMPAFIERVADKLKDHDYFEYCRPFLVKLGCIKEAQA